MGEPSQFVTRNDMLRALDAVTADLDARMEDMRRELSPEPGNDLNDQLQKAIDVYETAAIAFEASAISDELRDEVDEALEGFDPSLTVSEIRDVLIEKIATGSPYEVIALGDVMREMIRDIYSSTDCSDERQVKPEYVGMDRVEEPSTTAITGQKDRHSPAPTPSSITLSVDKIFVRRNEDGGVPLDGHPPLSRTIREALDYAKKFGCGILRTDPDDGLQAVSPSEYFIARTVGERYTVIPRDQPERG